MNTETIFTALLVAWISLAVISGAGFGLGYRAWHLFTKLRNVWHGREPEPEDFPIYPRGIWVPLFCAPCAAFWAGAVIFSLQGLPGLQILGLASFSWLASKVINNYIK